VALRLSCALSIRHGNFYLEGATLCERATLGGSVPTNQLTVSQERGFESNHLVFLKARPQHTMERWWSRVLEVP
jgi:hypothetical protein